MKKATLTEVAFYLSSNFMYPPVLFFYFHSFILHYRHSPFDHAVQHNNRRDALNNHDQGAEAEEEQDQGAAYEDLVGCTR